jgi:hypothetical protein
MPVRGSGGGGGSEVKRVGRTHGRRRLSAEDPLTERVQSGIFFTPEGKLPPKGI